MSGLAALGRLVGGGVDGVRMRKQDDMAAQDQAYRQEARDRERKSWRRQDDLQTKTDLADAAFAKYLDDQRNQWAQSTGQPPEDFRPDLSVQVGALDARGTQLATQGNWRELLKQRVEAAPIYTAARNRAIDQGMAQYEADGDPIKLAQTVYPHIRDGRKIVMAKTIKGPDGKPSVQFSMDDGTTEAVTQDKLVETVKRVRNPEFAAMMDVEHFKARMKADEEKRKLEGAKELENVRQAGRLGLADVQGRTAKEVATIRADATTESAATRAKAGGGGADAGKRIQRTSVDSEGFMVGTFRDGTTRRLEINGQPVRSGEWAKRVDKVAGDMGKGLGGMGKSPAELRQQAEQMLLGGGGAQPAESPQSPTTNKDFSNLWK